MKHINWRVLVLTILFGSVFIGWRTDGQGRPTPPPPSRQWEYQYDTATKSFPSEADKAKISLYAVNGWELAAAVREEYQTALVFKRLK